MTTDGEPYLGAGLAMLATLALGTSAGPWWLTGLEWTFAGALTVLGSAGIALRRLALRDEA